MDLIEDFIDFKQLPREQQKELKEYDEYYLEWLDEYKVFKELSENQQRELKEIETYL